MSQRSMDEAQQPASASEASGLILVGDTVRSGIDDVVHQLTVDQPEHFDRPYLAQEIAPIDSKRKNLRWYGRVGLRSAGAILAVAAPPLAGVAAVEHMQPTQTSIVGFEATSKLQIGHDSSRLDTGWTGSLISPAHRNILGINIGMNVAAQGDGVDLNDSTTRNALGEVFSNPQPEIDRVVSETTNDALNTFLLESGKVLSYELLAGGLVYGSRKLFGPRGELLSDDKQRKFYRYAATPIAATFFAGAVIAPAIQGADALWHPEHSAVVADPAFAGTGLEGMQLKGPINNAVPTIVNGFHPSEKLNEVTTANALDLFASRPDLQPQVGWTNWLQADDLQDRSSMAQQVGVAGKALNVKFILLSGDASTISQIGFGSYIFDTVRHYSDGIDTLAIDGDHDTKQTNYYAELAGFSVADNKTHDIAGIPILGLNSVQISTLGVDGIPTVDREDGVNEKVWIDNAVAEIKASNPQIVTLHDYKAAIKLAKAAIIAGHPIPFIDAGRSFKQLGPMLIKVKGHEGSTILFVAGSSGAHNNTSPEFGNIPIPAPVNLFSRNDTTGQVNVVTITYHPDGTVTASEPTEIVAPSTDSVISSAGTDHKDTKADGGVKVRTGHN